MLTLIVPSQNVDSSDVGGHDETQVQDPGSMSCGADDEDEDNEYNVQFTTSAADKQTLALSKSNLRLNRKDATWPGRVLDKILPNGSARNRPRNRANSSSHNANSAVPNGQEYEDCGLCGDLPPMVESSPSGPPSEAPSRCFVRQEFVENGCKDCLGECVGTPDIVLRPDSSEGDSDGPDNDGARSNMAQDPSGKQLGLPVDRIVLYSCGRVVKNTVCGGYC